MIWCKQRFDNAKSCLCRASCPVVLSCAVCFCSRCYVLTGSTGVICMGEKTGARERSNICRKRKKKKSSKSQQHVLYPVLLYVRKKAHSAARHSTAAKGTAAHRTAPHGSALHYAALLGYIYVCTGLDLAHRRLTPDFTFIYFWWRHELRQL